MRSPRSEASKKRARKRAREYRAAHRLPPKSRPETYRCSLCKGLGHNVRLCPQRAKPAPRTRCSECDGIGHNAASCSTARVSAENPRTSSEG